MDALTTLKEQKANLMKAMSEIGEQGVKDRLKRFFADVPEAIQVGWLQYTPYFNDGDPCVFSLHSIGIRFDKDFMPSDESYSDNDWLWYGTYKVKNFAEGLNPPSARANEVVALCQSLEDDIKSSKDLLEIVFGDHIKITATPNAIVVEEYDHD